MKDVSYFVEKEKEYKATHKQDPEIYYDEEAREFLPVRNADDFLQKGNFGLFSQGEHSPELKSAIEKYGLCESEVLILLCFLGNMSQYFRNDAYCLFGEIPEVAVEMQKVLDSIILKAPKHEGQTLYRFLNSNDQNDLKDGEKIVFQHSLTTTTDDWGKETDSYAITPLGEEKTKAHDIYKILNHGDENQVNFQRGAKFKVLSTLINPENNCKRIYLQEIE